MKTIRTNSDNPLFKELVVLLDQEVTERYGAIQKAYEQHNRFTEPADVCLISEGEQPIACGAIRQLEGYNWAEMKRVYVRSDFRRKGLSKRIVLELEKWSAEQGFDAIVLETGARLFEAVALYKKMDYQVVENFGPYADRPYSICMKKDLK